jgi:hypothetical protein
VRSEWRTIHLHREAPPKPAIGEPCNGCGVCCAAETCPAGRILFLKRNGPCPALEWQKNFYRCGLLTKPARYLRWLPESLASRIFARWIAAGTRCDSDATLHFPKH